MSGVIHAIGKIFSGIGSAVKSLFSNNIVKSIGIAAAAYFVGSAASSYFSDAGAAGASSAGSALANAGSSAADSGIGLSAADTAGMNAGDFTGVAQGTGMLADSGSSLSGAASDMAGSGTGSLFTGQAIGSTLQGMNNNGVGNFSDSAISGAVASTSVGNAPDSVALGAGTMGTDAMSNGGGALTGTANGLNGTTPSFSDLAQAATPGGSTAADGTYQTMSDPLSQSIAAQSPASAGMLSGGAASSTVASTAGQLAQASNGTPGLGTNTVAGQNSSSGVWNTLKSWGSDAKSFLFGSPGSSSSQNSNNYGGSGSGGGGLFSGVGGGMLASTLINTAAAALKGPVPQMQYSGVNHNGSGPGLGLHTTAGGFGLAVGGGQPAPTGIPNSLTPSGIAKTAQQQTGANLSLAGLSTPSSGQTAGNLGQTVANTVGIGGLVPQGAINYMGAA